VYCACALHIIFYALTNLHNSFCIGGLSIRSLFTTSVLSHGNVVCALMISTAGRMTSFAQNALVLAVSGLCELAPLAFARSKHTVGVQTDAA